MRGFLRFGLVVIVVGCGSKKEGGGTTDDPPARVRLELGDCAAVTVPFVSGPRPLRFEQESAGYVNVVGTGDISTGFDDQNIYGGLLGNEAGEMSGGFGFARGSGSGGGAGWGTIGTGRYGTIGHGTGTGYGYGNRGGNGMRGRSAAVPTVSVGQPNAQGDLDKAIIRRYIKRNISKLQYCYEKELLAHAGLQGTVSTQFFISPSGGVTNSSASGVSPNVANCVADVIKDIQFPKPRGGGGVQVNYPFTFRPAEGSTPVMATGLTGGSNAGSDAGSNTAGSNAGSNDQDPNKVGRYDMKPASDSTTPYTPGATSPLHDQEHALVECVRALNKPYGVLVVDLAYDAAGGVTKATESGVDDKSFASCVVAAAMKVKRTDKTATAQRCGVAFGVMPATDVPTIAITADNVTFNGAVVDHVKDIVADDSATWKIAALFEALDTWAQRDPKSPIHLRGPGLLEPIDATPMKIVTRVLSTSYAAGTDFVLAVQRGGKWQPLRDAVVPVVPVPLGTGVSWNGKPYGEHATNGGDERVELSILVDKDHIWVGLSRVNEFQDLPGRDWAKLEATLKEHKAAAFFADRTDIQIAGTDEVIYSDVTKVIDVATRVGFLEWKVMDPVGLSARPQQ